MLTLLLGTDWVLNRDCLLKMVAKDVAAEKANRIFIVPELISHDMERRLCHAAGDTSSRFAEILSFTRLYRRVCDIQGFGSADCLDNGGRVAAMASAARQLHGQLKAYAALETRPEFLTGLVEAVDEFKRCCITAGDLLSASKQTSGILAQKLEELSLIYSAYDALCVQGKKDPSDQMTWLLEQLESSDYAQEHIFYIDGFPDFTRQHMAILQHLIEHSQHVYISLNCDEIGSKAPAFEKPGNTAMQLYRFAHDSGIEVQIRKIEDQNYIQSQICKKLFTGPVKRFPDADGVLHAYRAKSVYDEVLMAAEKIMDLVRAGARYRDIGVACSDMAAYQNAVNIAFARCRIPVYQSGTDDILEKPIIATVLTAIDAALNGFERREMIRYIKSMLSPLPPEQSDRIENYTILWNISGNRWKTPWVNHPVGLGEEWKEADYQTLAELNDARVRIIEPLIRLQEDFCKAVSVEEQVCALYAFLKDIRLHQRLCGLAKQMGSIGDNRNVQILNQLWEIFLTALEQIYDILGKTAWEPEAFTRLLRLILSQYDVGTIPPVLDAVTVGSVSAMRCQQTKHVFVLGALEGSLPGYNGSSGVLTDQERTMLRHIGIPLTGGGIEGIQTEFFEIYGVFCGARESIHISCPAGQPSFLYRRLQELCGEEEVPRTVMGAARVDPLEAGAFLTREGAKDAMLSLRLDSVRNRIETFISHAMGAISEQNIHNIYGDRLTLSASQADRQADCRLMYFLKYGLGAKERKTATVDPAEFGTYVHAVLENTVKTVMEHGGFHTVALEETLKIAAAYSEQYIQDYFAQIDSQRLQYLFKKNESELMMIVQELWHELRDSRFEPVAFELGFGENQQMEAISIDGHLMSAQLRGFVDRVDAWQENGQNYYRVVDYKTGKKDFDYCDVLNGYGLQMLLYLFALEDGGEGVLGTNPVPAGVQYFPARAPYLAADAMLTKDEAEAERAKAWKRKGLLLLDKDVLEAMEPGEKTTRLCCTVKKDGSVSGDVADRQQMKLLKEYVFNILRKMVDEIASGKVEPNPYTRGVSHNACAFCPYGSICYKLEVAGRRNYKAVNAQQFWESVEREVKKDG